MSHWLVLKGQVVPANANWCLLCIDPFEALLCNRLVGQKGPIRSVASAIRLWENGWVDPDRPLVLLFLGSSGVGKTELAKQIALYKYGKDSMSTQQSALVNKLEQERSFIRIDMSEYQASGSVYNLTGASKGCVVRFLSREGLIPP